MSSGGLARDEAATVACDELELLTDYLEQLRFIRKAVAIHVSPARRVAYAARLDAIERRASDPRLHLAVVGEFSSGKSTFINALMRRKLLKASCVATTASVTRILAGAELSVTATFTDGTVLSGTELDHAALRQRVARIQPAKAAGSLQALLDLLTSDVDVANEVRELELMIPPSIMDEKLIILDTPGIGAGADEAIGHAELTEHVLKDEADCAVVLIHATRGMTATLLDFLDQHVKLLFPRCAFVISAMDRYGDAERAEIEALVRSTLHQKFAIDRPLLFQSGAAAMLEMPAGACDATSMQRWQSQFLFVESSLKNAMLRRRTLIVGEHLVRLLQDVLKELGDDLEVKLKELASEQRLLATNSVAAIETVLEEMYTKYEKELHTQSVRLKTRASVKSVEYAARAKSLADSFVRNCGWSIKNYAQEVAPRLQALVQEQGRAYADELGGEISTLHGRGDRISAEFVRRFEESYRSFPSLGVRITVPSVSSLPVRNIPFHASRVYVEEQNSGDRKGGGKGAATGAAVGLLFGPVGALVGALIGGGVGYTYAGDSLEARQQKVIASASPEIDACFEVCREEVHSFIDSAILGMLRQVHAAVTAHLAQYGDAAGHLLREHENGERRLQEAVRRVREDQAELFRRRARLETAQLRLTNEPKGQL